MASPSSFIASSSASSPVMPSPVVMFAARLPLRWFIPEKPRSLTAFATGRIAEISKSTSIDGNLPLWWAQRCFMNEKRDPDGLPLSQSAMICLTAIHFVWMRFLSINSNDE